MYYIGIDLGGTNIAAGIVNESNEIIIKDSVPTGRLRSFNEIMDDMMGLCKALVQKAGLTEKDIFSIGIGCPGSVDKENKRVSYANNLPDFNGAPIYEEIKKHFPDAEVYLENDANAAAYGEYIAGAAVGNKNVVAVTLGTGIGGGIIINGKIYDGFNGAGAEIGHMVIVADGEPCTCGRRGCWEAYASVTALIRETEEEIKNYPDSIIHDMIKKYGKISGRTAFDAMRAGDEAGRQIVDKYIEYVGIGMTNIINIFQPEKIVIGGGISKEGDTLLNPLKKMFEEETYAHEIENIQATETIVAKLGNDAGIIGAAMLFKQETEN